MPWYVGPKARLKPMNPMTNKLRTVIMMVLYRLLSNFLPSSPISRNPTDIVIENTSTAAIKIHKLLKRFAVIYTALIDRTLQKNILNAKWLKYGTFQQFIFKAHGYKPKFNPSL